MLKSDMLNAYPMQPSVASRPKGVQNRIRAKNTCTHTHLRTPSEGKGGHERPPVMKTGKRQVLKKKKGGWLFIFFFFFFIL